MATDPTPTRGTSVGNRRGGSASTETKAAFTTTEFVAYLAILAGILIAGAVTGDNGDDSFVADDVWLFATLLTIGYMISRGLAKSGSSDPYTEDGDRR